MGSKFLQDSERTFFFTVAQTISFELASRCHFLFFLYDNNPVLSPTCQRLDLSFSVLIVVTFCERVQDLQILFLNAARAVQKTKVRETIKGRYTYSDHQTDYHCSCYRYPSSDHHLRIQAECIPFRATSEKICSPDFDRRRPNNGSCHPTHMR